MSNAPSLTNCLRERRVARGWRQQELADRAGISRASISAIEIGRLIPSAAAALALAAALDCRVEDLFELAGRPQMGPTWAWPSTTSPSRYWEADVGTRRLLYPYENTQLGTLSHDGVAADGHLQPRIATPPSTLVMACCDPAVGLMARELAQVAGIRLLAFFRSSRQALALLKQGLVHVAGLHLSGSTEDGNVAAVRAELDGAYRLVRVVRWDEGVVTTNDRKARLPSIVRSRLNWIGREPGSGARQCMDELFGNRRAPRRLARDHRGVAEAVRSGWADAGVCLRLAAEEAGLRFLPVRQEAYDLCFAEVHESDPRIRALLAVLRSSTFRQTVDDLPGYNARDMGSTANVLCGAQLPPMD